MTLYNFGSINRDMVYEVAHLPAPGETIASLGFSQGLGGKGANQSVAAARAGAEVVHIGAVGADGDDCLAEMQQYGVDVSRVHRADAATGHAVIYVDREAENQIVIHHGANTAQSIEAIKSALDGAGQGDYLLIQNETTLTAETAELGRKRDIFVIYSAAPFEARAVEAMLPFIDLLVMNRGEAEELERSLKIPLAEIPVPNVLVTLGGDGALWRDQESGEATHVPAFPAEPLDTTGAGDCFIGTLAAALCAGESRKEALKRASAAASIQVSRTGAAKAMPSAEEVSAIL